MEIKEKIEIIEMLHKLPEEKQWEIYFMIKGAALIADKTPIINQRSSMKKE